MSVRWSAVLSAGVLAALLTAVPAVAASAADPLELSTDGTTWSAQLPTRLFASPAVIVPGDVVTAVLWVRNSTGDPARVDLEVADDLGASPGTLAGDLSLTIDGAPMSGGASWHGPDLAPGASARIALVVTFAASSQSTTRTSIAAVLDSVTLVQTAVGPAAGAPTASPTHPATASPTQPPASTGGPLAHTGAEVARVVGVSFAAVLLGVLLVAVRRRARRVEP